MLGYRSRCATARGGHTAHPLSEWDGSALGVDLGKYRRLGVDAAGLRGRIQRRQVGMVCGHVPRYKVGDLRVADLERLQHHLLQAVMTPLWENALLFGSEREAARNEEALFLQHLRASPRWGRRA